MAAHDQSLPPIITEHPDPVLIQRHNNATISDKIAGVVLTAPTPKQWFVILGIAFLVLQFLPFAMGNLLLIGVGKFGINQPVGWGMDIINFVWWIGIGHAGTLISAILMLFRQEWRMAIARFAELRQPSDSMPKIVRATFDCARSRSVAMSGTRPVNQNSADTVP